jgi:hypothetical protein
VFLLTGLLTAVIGVIFLFTVPDNQLNARWLSKEDRILAIERIRINQQGVGNKHFKWYQLREALADPLTWAFVFYALVADIPNGMLLTAWHLLLVRSLTNIPRRRHQQLLQPAHQIFRLHITAIPTLRHARWCRRDRGAHRMRICRRLLQESHFGQHVRAHRGHHRHVSHRWATTWQRQRPPRRVLPDPSIAHAIRRFPVFDQQQCRRLHQKDYSRCSVPHWILVSVTHHIYLTVNEHLTNTPSPASATSSAHRPSDPKTLHATFPPRSPSSAAGACVSWTCCSSTGIAGGRMPRKLF